MLIRVKKLPVAENYSDGERKLVELLNSLKTGVSISMINGNVIDSLDILECGLEQGMYAFCINTYGDQSLTEMLDTYDLSSFVKLTVKDLKVKQSVEIKILCSSDMVRDMCVKNRYYTSGDSNSYLAMLSSIYEKTYVTDKDIYKIAENIKAHSKTEDRAVDIARNIFADACTVSLRDKLVV